MKRINRIKAAMGDTYLCHPSNHVKRLAVPLSDSVGTNIADTFERIRRERKAAEVEAQQKVQTITRRT